MSGCHFRRMKLGGCSSVLFLSALLFTTATVSTVEESPISDASVKYLLPVLLYGPNNQFQGLNEALVIAKVTNRTLLLPLRFSKWFKDEVSPESVAFDRVFDPTALFAFTPCTFADTELAGLYKRKQGWAVLASPVPSSRLSVALANLGLYGTPARKSTIPLRQKISDITETFSTLPFSTATFVAIAPFHALQNTGAVEKELIVQAAAACRRAPHVRKYAAQLRASLFGQYSGPLLAVHIRREASDLGCESGRRFVVCPTPGQTVTTEEIAESIRNAIAKTGATNVYLAHANVGGSDMHGEREALLAVFDVTDGDDGAVHIKARSASGASMPAMSKLLQIDAETVLTPFDVSLVEQELCASAESFLPSALSTWSSNVKLDRKARSRPTLPEIDRPYYRG